jgi:hypothetical protein
VLRNHKVRILLAEVHEDPALAEIIHLLLPIHVDPSPLQVKGHAPGPKAAVVDPDIVEVAEKGHRGSQPDERLTPEGKNRQDGKRLRVDVNNLDSEVYVKRQEDAENGGTSPTTMSW